MVSPQMNGLAEILDVFA